MLRDNTYMQVRTTLALVIAFVLCVPLLPSVTVAQESDGELVVAPVVIDEKAKVRDILKQNITIVNRSNRKLNLYPAVNDVNPEEGQEEFSSAQNSLDRMDSLANWIELSRGVIEMNPGEEKTIPFVIRVNMNAKAGSYHANISFYEGGSRESAEATRPLATIMVNTEVLADVKEVMQLNKFFTDNFFFSGDDVLFSYQLQNIGNQDLRPKGEIRIYDRRGREVAAVPVNADGKTFSPEQMSQLASVWNGASGFGKFKAFLNVDYGNNQNGTLQDTIYFWIIPWQQLLAVLIISLTAIVVSAIYFHRWLEHRHMQKFALATGVAAPGVLGMPGIGGLVPPPAVQEPPRPEAIPAPASEVKKQKKVRFARTRRFFRLFLFWKKRKAAEPVIAEALHDIHPSTIVAETHVMIPTPRPVAPTMVAPQAAVSTPPVSRSHTIDLKAASQKQNPSTSVRTQGHVINLKNGS